MERKRKEKHLVAEPSGCDTLQEGILRKQRIIASQGTPGTLELLRASEWMVAHELVAVCGGEVKPIFLFGRCISFMWWGDRVHSSVWTLRKLYRCA